MKNRALFISVFMLLVCFKYSLFGQTNNRETIGTTGNTYETTSMTMSFTVGDVAISSFTNYNIKVLEGFQQPYINVLLNGVNFELFALLEGPFNSGQMTDSLTQLAFSVL